MQSAEWGVRGGVSPAAGSGGAEDDETKELVGVSSGGIDALHDDLGRAAAMEGDGYGVGGGAGGRVERYGLSGLRGVRRSC